MGSTPNAHRPGIAAGARWIGHRARRRPRADQRTHAPEESIMKSLNIRLTIAAIAAACALSGGVAAAAGVQTLNSGDVETMHLWHGNGAGLEGADRIALIGKRLGQAKPIAVTYDEQTIKRTNMRRAEVGITLVTVNADRGQDRDERTGAPVFAATRKPYQAAGTPAPKAN
jgi:hypothetical protein